MSKRKPTYMEAIIWIAENDEAGGSQSPEEIALYISSVLVSDLFGVDPIQVGQHVVAVRENKVPSDIYREYAAAMNRIGK